MKLFSAILVLLTGCMMAAAQTVPNGMTYQGRLTDASNAPVPDGNGYEIEVRLWSASTGGTLLWGTRYTGIPLKNGTFNLILGPGGTPIAGASTTDLKTAFITSTVHLGLTTTKTATGAAVTSPTEILPRQEIFSTPFAFRSDKAEDSTKLGGQPAGYYSPTGSIVAFAGTTVPAGWLLCDGSTVTSTAYPALFSAIGTTFGTTGVGTFKLPDMRGRFPLGTNPSPLPEAPTARHLAQSGGAETHTLTLAEIPSHSHDQRYSTGQNNGATGVYVAGLTYADGAARGLRSTTYDQQSPLPIVPTGGGEPHNNMPPFVVFNFIIKH